MCRAIRCPTCTLWTWTGCGRHQDVLDQIPAEQHCSCGD